MQSASAIRITKASLASASSFWKRLARHWQLGQTFRIQKPFQAHLDSMNLGSSDTVGFQKALWTNFVILNSRPQIILRAPYYDGNIVHFEMLILTVHRFLPHIQLWVQAQPQRCLDQLEREGWIRDREIRKNPLQNDVYVNVKPKRDDTISGQMNEERRGKLSRWDETGEETARQAKMENELK